MPYSTRYVLQQMARGRPIPTGSPDPELFRACEQVCPVSIERAISKGASARAVDSSGRAAVHVLLDRLHERGPSENWERAAEALRALLRHNCDLSRPHPRLVLSAAARAAVFASTPVGTRVWHMIEGRFNPRAPERDGSLVRDAWLKVATPMLAARIAPSAAPGPAGPKP